MFLCSVILRILFTEKFEIEIQNEKKNTSGIRLHYGKCRNHNFRILTYTGV